LPIQFNSKEKKKKYKSLFFYFYLSDQKRVKNNFLNQKNKIKTKLERETEKGTINTFLQRKNHTPSLNPIYPQANIIFPQIPYLSLSLQKIYFLSLQFFFSLAHHRHRRRLIQKKKKQKDKNLTFS
jgi:hypothetical protein